MSVVVRMEMPKDCGECRFRSDGWCYGIREFDPQPGPLDFEKRPSWCPIICSLPEGHGRLVDADAMDKRVYNDIQISVFGSVKKMAAVRQIIEDAPTIVPAEEERS